MNNKTLLLMGLCTAIGSMSMFARLAVSAEVEAVKSSETAQATIKAIREHQKLLTEAVKNKKLETAHEEVDIIEELSEELADQVAAGQKPVVEKLVSAISDVHDSVDNNDQVATEARLKKLDAVLKSLKDQFEPPGTKKEKIPEVARSTLESIHKHHKDLTEAVKNKKLETAREEADAIEDLSGKLAYQLTASQKPAVEKLVSAISDVRDSAADNDQVATEAKLKKLDEVLKNFREQFE